MPTGTTVTAPSDGAARSERFRVQRILWEHSTVDKVRACGHHAVNTAGLVGIKHTANPDGSRHGGFSGLSTCSSVWACPSCNHKIASRRAEELGEAIRLWESRGGVVVMVTLTTRHKRGNDLVAQWDAVSKGWARVTSGKAWVANQEQFGFTHEGRIRIPWARAVEVTLGDNGWHVHIHALLFLPAGVDQAKADYLGQSMFARWSAGLVAQGQAAPIQDSGGLDVKVIKGDADAMSTYLTKSTYDAASGAGWEVAGGAMKDGKRGGRTPFQILRTFVETGDLDDLGRWQAFEQASFGRRQLTWARWFIKYLAIEQLTDEEIAEEELDGEIIALVPAEEWKSLRNFKAELLRAVETLPLDYLRSNSPADWLTVAAPEIVPLTCGNSA